MNMYKQGLALNNLQWLICPKTQITNQTKRARNYLPRFQLPDNQDNSD